MATKLEIANRALAVLGHDRRITDFDADESTEAYRVREFFTPALDAVLMAHDWDSAAVEKSLLLVYQSGSDYARVPNIPDCIRIVRAVDAFGHQLKVKRNRDYISIAQGASNRVTLRYITSDITLEEMPPNFIDALVHQLASLLVGPMYGNDQKTQSYMTLARAKMSEAIGIETDETASPGEWENPYLGARN